MTVSEALLSWYDAGHREMPWRGTHDPWAVWVSETMLQQTRVETVIPYYLRFMADYPTLAALAWAPEADVLKHWEGLGYYSRARNLLAGARQVMAEYGGCLPRTADELRAIRGIGPYTAGAIASIAFGQPVAAVDGNVIRVTSRVCALEVPLGTAAGRRAVEEAAQGLVPTERPGDFNQAMMDLGSGVCVPGTPDCEACPLRGLCLAERAGIAERLPCLPRKKPPVPQAWDVLLIRRQGRYLMRQRTEALLRGLWVFPMSEGHRAPLALPEAARRLTGLTVAGADFLGEARHVFTHRVWEMRLWACETPAETPAPGWRWFTPAEMTALSIPTAMRAALQWVRQAEKAEE